MSFSYAPLILLVDGYNIIGAWHELKSLRDRDLEAARDRLVDTLINYSASKGYQTQIVFDAHLQASPKFHEAPTDYLSVYYTAYGETADTYIEKCCAHNFRKGKQLQQRLIVATSDRAQQLTVSGYGAEWRSARQLENDVNFAKRKTRSKQRSRQKSQGRFLVNALDPKAQKQLSKLRRGSL
ncbi:MAG: RNA-binding protein [Cyanobacteria bacterium SW_9_44_58]|nr:MAG: RNA-binding protein [Cyanobacteria bacterium SW_9_44_58]